MGAQWSKLNRLSGGAPASFKGFGQTATLPNCGIGWSIANGNASPPPAGQLPEYMAVIVTSSARQNGSVNVGNTVHMVIVRTNPGYQPDPSNPGTGTVVAQLC